MVSIRSVNRDWLSLVEQSGLFISEPVLLEKFPSGPDKLKEDDFRRYRKRYEKLSVMGGDDSYTNAFINYIFKELLNYSEDYRKQNLPETLSIFMPDYDQNLKASWALFDKENVPILIGMVFPSAQELNKRETNSGKWKATPVTKMERLLRETGVELGVLTNGEDFRLIYAPPGLSAASLLFSAKTFCDEKNSLDAFYTLLNRERFFGETRLRLITLARESQEKQIDVADQLGKQVREALSSFVAALDRSDIESGGELLSDLSEEKLYEMSLTAMMRMVFILYAEENRLLPHGEYLYDSAYGLGRLWKELEEDRIQERLDFAEDAFPRFLAVCRLIYEGCEHSDLKMPAYGGNLFDPSRFPQLEDERLKIPNLKMREILERLMFASARLNNETVSQRVSYRTLDVEQIGYVYEGLLDHRIGRAGKSVRLLLSGNREGEIDLEELEETPEEKRLALLAKAMDIKKEAEVKKKLEKGASESAVSSLTGDPEIRSRIAPYAPLIRKNGVIYPRRRYITRGLSRRISGSHYTPQYFTADIVKNALEPLVYINDDGVYKEPLKLKTPRQILDLKICDFAMGSGAFLVQAVRYLAETLVESWDIAVHGLKGGEKPTMPYAEPSQARYPERLMPEDREERLIWAKRYIASRCIYGVDKNHLAVEMAKLSLWLSTLAKDKPFTFLDHALKTGDSLLSINDEELKSWRIGGEEPSGQMKTFRKAFENAAQRAITLRKAIKENPVARASESAEKRNKLEEANRAVSILKLGSDLLIAPQFEENINHRKSLTEILLNEFVLLLKAEEARLKNYLKEDPTKEIFDSLRQKADELLGEERPFHWAFEFPEVFLEEESKGFDAIIGNPPFAGGQKLTGIYGTIYRDYLVENLAKGKRGSADLCSYFYLKAGELIRDKGFFGLIATNTIAQGDTREVGLDQLYKSGFSFPRAIQSSKWPGAAAVDIAIVWAYKGGWKGKYWLEGKEVEGVTPYLTKPGRAKGNPHRLSANSGKSFQGSIVLGKGFVLSPREAKELIAKDPRNKEVIFPYLNGEDLNSRYDQSPSRFVINFFDWPLDSKSAPMGHKDPVAEDYPDCLKIIEEKVKPERMKLIGRNNIGTKRGTNWWQYGSYPKTLNSAIKGMDRVLASSRVTKYLSFTFEDTNLIMSEATVVIAYSEYSYFSLLNSGIYELWAWKTCSTFRSAGIRFSPTDSFETFPFPEGIEVLEDIGERYYEHRRTIMLYRKEGLTNTYNRFHDPKDNLADIVKLRELHKEMDYAVRDRYGWDDLDLRHGFYETKQGVRYSFSKEVKQEVLDRLLELNIARYAEEAKRGLHDKKKASASKKRADKKTGALV